MDLTKKLTKKQYTTARAELVSRKNVIEAYIKKIIDEEIESKYEGLNAKHDSVWNIEQQIKSLDNAWDTRNWTAGDWASHSLVMQNID